MKSTKLYTISRIVLALLFIFSGITKSLNPFGLSIQIGEYFSAFGVTFLKPLAGVGGIMLPSVELLLGLMIALGLSRRISAWGAMLFMGFFTLLTLWIALTNPVSDCGCFGDVIKLSNWGTFIKNILLMPFVIIYFIGRGAGKSADNRLYLAVIPLSFAVAVYCYFNLPLIDATPYKIGVNVGEAISIPENAPQAESHTTLLYRSLKDGKIQEFQLEEEEWQDQSKWEYVDTKTIVISQGYQPPIKSLPMIGSDGEDISKEILESSQNNTLLLVVTTAIEKINLKGLKNFADRAGAQLVMLTSSPLPHTGDLSHGGIQILNSDQTVIHTIIQNSTGGALLLERGVITKKYVMRQLK